MVSLVLLVPFLELLFDKTKLVEQAPAFNLSKDYFIQTFYYYLSQKIISDGKVAALAFFCVVVSVIFLLKNLFRYLAMYVLAPLRNRLIYDMREAMYQKLLSLPISFFQRNQKGDIITKFTSDLTEIEYSIMNTLETSIQSPLTIILFLASMLFISAKLTLFVFAMILVMALVIGRIGKSLKKESKEGKEVLGRLTSILDETITGIKIIQAFFVQNWISQKFRFENQKYYNTYNVMYRKRDLSSPLTEFLAIVVICVILWYGGNMVFRGELLASTFIAFVVIFSQLIPPAKSFSSAVYEIKKGMASYDRIQTILKEESIELNETATKVTKFNNSISLENIKFKYPNSNHYSLITHDLVFEKGKKYALVGASGAGKSTLLDIILGFYPPTEGEVKIDDIPIRNISLESYRGLFGLVTQEAILFNASIDENIGFETIEKDNIFRALEVGNAISFSERIKNETIGERGSKLSGGEKQRLTIARVAYRNPEIILMDEATSALDSQNEYEVQQALDKLMENKTSIVIAHRLSTVKNADCIILMNEGKIIAKGTHEALYIANAVYKNMVDLQNLG